jgi:hypothetical protein
MSARKILPLKRGPGPKRTPHSQGVCPRCSKHSLVPDGGVVEATGLPHRPYRCTTRRCDYTELRPE